MTLFQLVQKPLYQAILFVLLTIGVAWILKPRDADKLWALCGLMYGLFIVANAAFAFFAIEAWAYFFISLGCSLLYLVVIAIMAKLLIKVLNLEGSEESAMVFLVIIFHPVALLLAIFFKWVIS